MRVILVTGGAGFIGSNFTKYFLRRNKDFVIVNIDNLSPSSNLNNLKELERSPRYHFVNGSICNQELVNYVIKRHRPEIIINFAAQSNVDKSLISPLIFSETNVLGTLTLLESARYFWGKNNFKGNRFIQISTSEVYGNTYKTDEFFSEESSLMPENPYSASKASSDLLISSFCQSYGFPAIITRCCQNYGPYQPINQVIPSCIISSLNNRDIPEYKNQTTKKEWIHVIDHCVALIRVMFYGKPGEIYNISSGYEFSDYEMSQEILRLFGMNFDTSKTDNAKRNTLNSYKIKSNLNWGIKYKLDDGIIDTIKWYRSNPQTLEFLK
ncbi:UNVERIFIED_CONTAM: dTDP-glucose 4,6-dehydratase [Acetivibrio alkalicellulosi]